VDGITEWTDAQQRVIELVADISPEAAEKRVPACPDWTVRELLSHMVGLGADVVAGDEPDDHNATWTAKQVAARSAATVADLVAEWQALAGPLREWMAARNTRPLGDVIIHEQDLRGALGAPGGQDSEGLAAIRDRFASRFAGGLGGLPPIGFDGGSWTWTSAGSMDGAAVVLQAPTFELARALMSRRSAAQLRAWTVRGDVGPYLPAFAQLGELPTEDLSES
jgi:uncharacterized protein (TIGR03083 family)